MSFPEVGRYEESLELFEKALVRRKEVSDEGDWGVLRLEPQLASAYDRSEKHQAALESNKRTLKKCSRIFGEDDPRTLDAMVATAIVYGKLRQPEKGIPLVIKALDIGSRIGLDEEVQRWEGNLEWLQSLRANPPETVRDSQSEPESLPDPERRRILSKDKLRFWQKARLRLGGPPS